MDPNNQFPDPQGLNDMEGMAMDPDDQMNEPDDNSQFLESQNEENNQTDDLNQSFPNDFEDTGQLDNGDDDDKKIQMNNEDDDDFIPEEQLSTDNDESTSNDQDKAKPLAEKPENQAGNLENTTTEIAMSLLPQSLTAEDKNENSSQPEVEKSKSNQDDNENQAENKDENENQVDNQNDNENQTENENQVDNQTENENENQTENQDDNENQVDNQNDNENQAENENENQTENQDDNENQVDNQNDNENQPENENENQVDNQDDNENQNENENQTEDQNCNENQDGENINPDENENIDENGNNEDESKEAENDQTANEGNDNNLQEEGMEVKDNMTPQRLTRPRKPITPIGSLSKLPPLQTDPEMDAQNQQLLLNFKKKGRLPEISQRAQFVQYIQREKVNSVIAQRFSRAQELQNLLQKFQKAVIEQESKDRNRDKIYSLKNVLDAAKYDLKQSDSGIKYKIEDEKEKQKKHYNELIQKQDEELDSFEQKWNDPNFIQKYAKPSSVLLTMKNIERSMVLTKMFDQAESIHNKVKELEKAESKQAQETAENEMEKEKQKILSRQAAEITAFEQHCTRQIETIERNYENERNKQKAKIAKLESEIKDLEKCPPPNLSLMAAQSPDFTKQSIMTPRTIQRYSMYKTQAKKPVLTLNPIKNIRPSKKQRAKARSSFA